MLTFRSLSDVEPLVGRPMYGVSTVFQRFDAQFLIYLPGPASRVERHVCIASKRFTKW